MKKPKWDRLMILLAFLALLLTVLGVVDFVNQGNFCLWCKDVEQHITYIEEGDYIPPDHNVYVTWRYDSDSFEGITDSDLIDDVVLKNLEVNLEFIKEDVVIPKFQFGVDYWIGQCNVGYSDCYIYDLYRADNYDPSEICYEADVEDTIDNSISFYTVSQDPECNYNWK